MLAPKMGWWRGVAEWESNSDREVEVTVQATIRLLLVFYSRCTWFHCPAVLYVWQFFLRFPTVVPETLRRNNCNY